MTVAHRFHTVRIAVTGSLWFVPGLCVLAGLVLAVGLTALDVRLGHQWIATNSYVFGVGAEGARGMLSAIAGSMMTVASLSFSLTISTLATASGQYTSSLVRNFMRDRLNQFVLGFFVGLFGYCLVVLRSIRSGDEGGFVPSIAVFGGLLLALASIGVLVYFIHHIAESIQSSVILARVTAETVRAIETLFPDDAGTPSLGRAVLPGPADDAGSAWHAVTVDATGYVQGVDTAALIRAAVDAGTVIRMEADIGVFVGPDAVICTVAGVRPPGRELADTVRDAYAVGPARTIEQDPAFGVRQIVDIALKALSPGINDTTTGVSCVQHLGVILAAVARRDTPDRFRAEDGTVRLIARGRTFAGLLRLALDQIRANADRNAAVLTALLDAITVAARQTQDADRLALLGQQARLVAGVADRTLDTEYDRDAVRVALTGACAKTTPPGTGLAEQWLPAGTAA